MNKADNDAGNAAIDSLLNYETVKVSDPLRPRHKPPALTFLLGLSWLISLFNSVVLKYAMQK